MAANYSTNPTNPVNQAGGQMQQNQPQYVVPKTKPSSIRDYLEIARSQGWGTDPNAPVPRFTNMPGDTQGYNIQGMQGYYDVNEQPPQQAIPAGPDNEYDKIPFNEKIKMDPYVRAKQRLETILPIIYEQMFPGRDPNGELSQQEMNQWTGAVQKITGDLVQRYDSQYAYAIKNDREMQKRWEGDLKDFQMEYHRIAAKNGGFFPTINPRTGMPYTMEEFVQENIDYSSRAKMERQMMSDGQNGKKQDDGTRDYKSIVKKLNSLPELKARVKLDIKREVGNMLGRTSVSESEMRTLMSDQAMREHIARIQEQVIESYLEEIQAL